MAGFILRRLLLALAVAATISVISFTLIRLSGDLAQALAGPSAGAAEVEAVRKAYGLDKPLPVQYVEWLGGLVRGDLGQSYYFRKPVMELLSASLPVTATLGISALTIALVLGTALGIAAALRQGSWIDYGAQLIALLGQAVPTFWLSLMLIVLFGLILQWTPISGGEGLEKFTLPAIVLGIYSMPAILRLIRAGMLEVMRTDYIRTARAKGLRPSTIIVRHALRNAIAPVVALAAVQLGLLLGGSVVVETVFTLHGVGYLAWESILRSDFPVVQAIVLLLSFAYILLTMLADILNAVIDPRLRVG